MRGCTVSWSTSCLTTVSTEFLSALIFLATGTVASDIPCRTQATSFWAWTLSIKECTNSPWAPYSSPSGFQLLLVSGLMPLPPPLTCLVCGPWLPGWWVLSCLLLDKLPCLLDPICCPWAHTPTISGAFLSYGETSWVQILLSFGSFP